MQEKNKTKEIRSINNILTKAKKHYSVFFKSFYSSPVAKALIDFNTNRYFEVNDKFLKLFECKKSEVLNHTSIELGFTIENEQTSKILKSYSKKKINTFNFDVLTKTKKIKNVIITTEKIKLFNKSYLIGYIIDNTSKAVYENRIEESEHRYSLVLKNTPNAIYEYDFKKTQYTYISPSVKTILGISPDTFIKKRFNIITPLLSAEYRKKIKDHYKSLKSSTGKRRKNFSFEYPFTQKNKTIIWISDNQTVIYDKNGKADKVIGNISDITIKKTNEFLLKQSEEQYKYLFNRNPLPMWIYDFRTNRILSVNEAAVKHYGYSTEEFLRLRITDLRQEEEVERYLKYREEVISDKKQNKAYFAGVWKHKKKNGQIIEVEITRAPVKFQGNNAVLILINDITENQKADERVKKKNEEIKLLYEFHKEVSSTLEPVKIYDIVYRTVKKNISCDSMSISAYDNQTKTISCLSFWQDNTKIDIKDFPRLPLEPPGKGIQSQIIRSGRPRIINEYDKAVRNSQRLYYFQSDGNLIKEPPKDAEVVKCAIMVPLKLQSKVIGIISIFSYIPDLYTIEDLNFLEALSSQVSTAAANALLYKKAQDELEERKIAEAKLLKLSDELSNFYDLSRDITKAGNVQIIFKHVLKFIGRVYPECDAGISLYDPESDTIEMKILLTNDKILQKTKFPKIKLNKNGSGIHSTAIFGKKTSVNFNYKEYIKEHIPQYYVQEKGVILKRHSKDYIIANSTIVTPIIYEDKVKGTIQLLNYSENKFNDETIRFIEILASHLAASLTNAELYNKLQNELKEKRTAEKALQSKTEELQILYEAQQVLSGSLDIDSIYDNTYKIIYSKIPCDSMIISSFDKSANIIKILSVWADGVKPDIKIFPQIPLAPKGKGIQSEVIRSGKPLLIDNYKEYYEKTQTHISYTNDKIITEPAVLYNSAMLVPMIHEGNIIGVIQLLSYSKNVYNKSSLSLLESLASPISAATFNASLYRQAKTEIAEKQKAREELALRNKEITLLYSAGRELLSTLDLEEIYEILYRKVIEIIPCDSMIIAEYKKQQSLIFCKAAWVGNTKHDPGNFPHLKVGNNYKGTQCEAIITGMPLIVNNFYDIIKERDDKYYFDDEGNVINYEEKQGEISSEDPVIQSAMYIPMKIGKNVIGVVSVFSYTKNAYTEYDLKILESITVHVSVAAANAELYRRAQKEISERIQKEDELKQIRNNLEDAQRIAHIGSWVYDIRKNRMYNSSELYRILGINKEPDGFEFDEAMSHIYSEDREKTINKLKKAVSERTSYENEDRILRPDGEIRNVKIAGEPMYDKNGIFIGMQGTLQDITEIKRINNELLKSLNEKELILKEIHHRVKNNLQVVSSLLRLQSESIKDETAIGYLKMSEQRVKSMALIHQQLYRTKDLSRIAFREYIEDLCNYLFFAYDISFSRINLKLEVEEIFFGIDTALPCGLIINELVTNSIKHAFPDYSIGTLTVKLNKLATGKYTLQVKDDGKGAEAIDFDNTTSLGMELVKTLTEQLEGEIKVNSNNGTEITIDFYDQYSD